MVSKNFDEQYKNLNLEQKEAVDAVEGPVMVIAGPGTGKTRVLTLRIANILLKTQINPENILALTFTEHGAAQMRRRLAEIMGSTAYRVGISTFHGFCNNLIGAYPEEFGDFIGRKPANEVQQIELLQKIIESTPLKMLKPFGEPFFYLKEARRAISNLKREGVIPESFSGMLQKESQEFAQIGDLYYDSGRFKGKMRGKYADQKKQLDKNLELAKICQKYQLTLAEAKLYDYDDMILETLKALNDNKNFLLRLQEKFQYILVDEHQDTNNAQNKVLELLTNFFDQPNLFVVGDEKQAIFRFQGASLENFLYFKKLYPQAKLVALEKNYRSTQPILDSAQSFISNNAEQISGFIGGLPARLVSQVDHPKKPIEVYEFKRPESESYFVAQKIKELTDGGADASEIGVIYRDNRDAAQLADMLDKNGLSFRIESRGNILEDPHIRKLVSIFRFLNNFYSEEKLFEILNANWLNIPALDVYKITTSDVRRKTSLLELLADAKKLKELKVEATDAVTGLADRLLRWHRFSKNSTLPELFEAVVRESGFLKYILADKNSAVNLNRLDTLFSEIKNLVGENKNFNLADFVNYLDTLEKHNVAIKDKRLSDGPAAVRLMTAHGAKGLEFDHIFVVNCFDGHWGNRRVPRLIKLPRLFGLDGGRQGAKRPSEGGEAPSEFNDDERRLFYVAVTRARKTAYISYALSGFSKREQFASQFVEEIRPELKLAGQADRYEKEFEGKEDILYQAGKSKGFSIAEKEYLNHLFQKRGMSATALNNFLKCPWQYFYLSLLKIPRAKSKHQMYGTAIHAALKSFFDVLKNKQALRQSSPRPELGTKAGQAGYELLLSKFKEALDKEPLAENDLSQSLERGQEVLRAYFDQYKDSWNKNALNEFRIHNVFLVLSGVEGLKPSGEIKLTGSIDKIEYLNKNEINVVDYKTGKPRSRSELEGVKPRGGHAPLRGKTQGSTGDYKRQLVFYKLLLDQHPLGLKMISGEIDFVEPDTKGKFHKEKFDIIPADTKELKDLLLDVSDKIINLKFWNDNCDDRDCEYCHLRRFI